MIADKKRKILPEVNAFDKGSTTTVICEAICDTDTPDIHKNTAINTAVDICAALGSTDASDPNQCYTSCLSCERLRAERAQLIQKYEKRIKKMQERMRNVRNKAQYMQTIKQSALELKRKNIEYEKLIEKPKVT